MRPGNRGGGHWGRWEDGRPASLLPPTPERTAGRAPGTTATALPPRRSPTPHTDTCPGEHMHVHARASACPQAGGWGETGDPCDPPCGPHACLSPPHKLVCQQEDSGQALGGLLGLLGGQRGTWGAQLMDPVCVPVSAPQVMAQFCKGAGQREGGQRYLALCSCLLLLLWDPDILLLPPIHPQALVRPSQVEAITARLSAPPAPSSPSSPPNRFQCGAPKAGASGFRSQRRRPGVSQQVCLQ